MFKPPANITVTIIIICGKIIKLITIDFPTFSLKNIDNFNRKIRILNVEKIISITVNFTVLNKIKIMFHYL